MMNKALVRSAMIMFFCGSCIAQLRLPRQDKWEVSFFAGVGSVVDRDLLTPVQGQNPRTVGLGYDSSYQLGFRITENLGQHLGAELEYSVTDQELTFESLTPTLPGLSLDHRIHNINYSLLFYPFDRAHKIRPYGVAGAGAAYFQVDSQAEDDALTIGINLKERWKFAATVGGGVKIYLRDHWGVRFDLRDQISGVPDYGFPPVAPVVDGVVGPGLRTDGTLHNWQFNAGIFYAWGQ